MKHKALTQPLALGITAVLSKFGDYDYPSSNTPGDIDLPISPQLIEPHLILKAHPSLQISSD